MEFTMIRKTVVTAIAASLLFAGAASAQDAQEAPPSWLPSLITETPEQGFALAVTMARKGVTTTQTNREVLFALRPNYSHDASDLIQVSGVIASYFAIVAEANDHWTD